MSDSSITPLGEHRRKRVRKGTRSCWECRRRKIKCIYQSEDHSICVNCLDKGTTCLNQEQVAESSVRDGGNSTLGQRLGRLETMMEKFVEKFSHSTEGSSAHGGGPVDVLTPSATPASRYDAETGLQSLFDEVLGQQATQADISMMSPQSASISISNPPVSAGKGAPIGRIEKLRRCLAAMLPCQEDVDYLSDMSRGWWLIRRHVMPHLLRVPEDDLQKPFDVATVSASHSMVIARLLLCVALCIQQLPPNIDLGRLQTKVPPRKLMDDIFTFVTTTVTSDDELIGSIEGIECLILQGVYQVNAGSLRRSWLSWRRAINVAQLGGFHRVSLKTSEEALDLMESRRHYMWYQIMRGERYLSLILGVPSATSSAPFPFDDHASWLSTEDFYNKHLCSISGLILTRNQGDATHAFSITQEIDEKLDSLAKQMPRAWWEIPANALDGRTDEAATQYERLMCQIWHFELETLVHLPFMLRAATDRRYEYSRISCLSASRGLIRRWMVMYEMNGAILFSKLVDFQAFTAAVTILLGLLGSSSARTTTTDPTILKEQSEDQELVETVVQILESLKQNGTGVEAVNQSISVIRTLQNALRNEDNSSATSIRLTIQHFGTISIAHSGTVQSLEGDRILGANPRSSSSVTSTLMNVMNPPPYQTGKTTSLPTPSTPMPLLPSNHHQYQSINGNGDGDDVMISNNGGSGGGAWMNNPTVLQFTSSQFPTFETPLAMGNNNNTMEEWPFQESDIMLFDSLLNTDVEGSWDF